MPRLLTDKKILDMFAEIRDILKQQALERNAEETKRNAEETKRKKEIDDFLLSMHIKSDEETQELRKSLRAVGINVGGIGNSTGRMVEDMFFDVLADNPKIGGLAFNKVEKNLKTPKKKGEKLSYADEFDIVLADKNKIAIFEVKYRVRLEDVKNLRTKKLSNFKKHYPEKIKKEVYLGIAGITLEIEAENEAKKAGILLLRLKAGGFINKTTKTTNFAATAKKTTKNI